MIRTSKALIVLALPALLSLAAGSFTPVRTSERTLRSYSPDSVDRALVVELSRADRDEVAMSKAALPSLQDPEVKRFAQLMIDDHTSALAGVTRIANRLHYPLAPQPIMPPSTEATTDAQFIATQVTDHQQLLSALPSNDQAVKDAALRSHLVNTRHVVQAHLDRAKSLQGKMAVPNPQP